MSNDIIDNILVESLKLINEAHDLKTLEAVRINLFSKTGYLSNLMLLLKDSPKEEKPAIGKLINETRDKVSSEFNNKLTELKKTFQLDKEKMEALDVTLSKNQSSFGAFNLINIVKEDIVYIFSSMGFKVEDGPEIELGKYNFDLLNIPNDHPARDLTDTFYIDDEFLLRTQTSGVQVRVMEKNSPPIKIICPGKVYRPDDDATHSPMFHQIEGLYVDKDVTLADLKQVLEQFAKSFFNVETKVRFRPSFFPFTEPSVEVDVSCAICHGKGCSLCKNTGWLELLGAGVVNPTVLEMSNINSKKYSGFAFGIGIERAAMIKYRIPDMRILFDNDIRYLEQFRF